MKKIICVFLILLSITGFGFVEIGSALLTPFHFLFPIILFFAIIINVSKRQIYFKSPILFFAATVYISVVNIVYFNVSKHSSFIFSLIILFELFLVYNCVKQLEFADIKRVVKWIIFIYFINISITSLLILIKLYPSGFLKNIFAIYFYDNRIRPYGFADEPSYAAIIIVFSLYLLLKSNNFIYQKRELKWYFMAIITLLLTGSAYGYMLLGFLLMYILVKNKAFSKISYLILKNFTYKNRDFQLAFFFLFVPIIIVLTNIDWNKNKSIERLTKLYITIAKSNQSIDSTLKSTAYKDGSASMRITPTLYLIDNFRHSDLKFVLFGRGAGQSVPFFSSKFNVNYGDHLVIVLGFIPAFIYNYGLIGTLLFLVFFFYMFPKQKLILTVLFLMILPNADFNNQLFLFVLFIAMSAKHIEVIRQEEIKHIAHEKN